jgi:hypothetical protein
MLSVVGRIFIVSLFIFSLFNVQVTAAAPLKQAFLTVAPTSLNFGNVQVGTSSTSQSFVIANSFYATATITASITGDYSVSGCATVPAYGNCTAYVTFNPTATGLRTGAVNLDFNIPFYFNGTVGTVNFSGTGLPAAGRIAGSVKLDGAVAPSKLVKVFLNGAQPQDPTADKGQYGYDNLSPGSYTVSVDYDKTKYKTNDGKDSVTVNVTAGSTTGLDFNLLTISSTTTVPTTTAPTTAVVPTTSATTPVTTVTTVPGTTTTSPATTTSVTIPSGQVNFNIGKPTPGAQPNTFNVTMNLSNGLNNQVNVQNSVEITLEPGVRVAAATADVGSTRTEDNGRRVVWSGYNLPPGRSASLNLTLEAPPASAGAASIPLLNNVLVSVTDAVTSARYEGRAGAINSSSSGGSISLSTSPNLPSRPPVAGGGITDGNIELAWLVLTGGLILLGIGALWAANSFRRSRYRK